jgi:hypothetical protein
MTSMTFDIGFDLGLGGLINGEYLVVKDYNVEILQINNHVYLTIFEELAMDLYGVFICQQLSYSTMHSPRNPIFKISNFTRWVASR